MGVGMPGLYILCSPRCTLIGWMSEAWTAVMGFLAMRDLSELTDLLTRASIRDYKAMTPHGHDACHCFMRIIQASTPGCCRKLLTWTCAGAPRSSPL